MKRNRKYINWIRHAILTIVILGSVYLLFHVKTENENCEISTACQSCDKLKSCSKSEAFDAKKTMKNGE